MKVDDLDVVAAADRGLLEEWAVGLDALAELIGPRFFRREPRVRALAYVKALLSQVCETDEYALKLSVRCTWRSRSSDARAPATGCIQ